MKAAVCFEVKLKLDYMTLNSDWIRFSLEMFKSFIVLWSCSQTSSQRSSAEWGWPPLISSLWLQSLLSFPTSVCIAPSKLTVRIASSALSLLNLAGKLVVRNPRGWYQQRGAQQGRVSAGLLDIKWINGWGGRGVQALIITATWPLITNKNIHPELEPSRYKLINELKVKCINIGDYKRGLIKQQQLFAT